MSASQILLSFLLFKSVILGWLLKCKDLPCRQMPPDSIVTTNQPFVQLVLLELSQGQTYTLNQQCKGAKLYQMFYYEDDDQNEISAERRNTKQISDNYCPDVKGNVTWCEIKWPYRIIDYSKEIGKQIGIYIVPRDKSFSCTLVLSTLANESEICNLTTYYDTDLNGTFADKTSVKKCFNDKRSANAQYIDLTRTTKSTSKSSRFHAILFAGLTKYYWVDNSHLAGKQISNSNITAKLSVSRLKSSCKKQSLLLSYSNSTIKVSPFLNIEEKGEYDISDIFNFFTRTERQETLIGLYEGKYQKDCYLDVSFSIKLEYQVMSNGSNSTNITQLAAAETSGNGNSNQERGLIIAVLTLICIIIVVLAAYMISVWYKQKKNPGILYAGAPAKECKRCYQQINDESENDLYTTPCGHLFHFECIRKYVNLTPRCPLCEEPIKTDKFQEELLKRMKHGQ